MYLETERNNKMKDKMKMKQNPTYRNRKYKGRKIMSQLSS